MKRLAKIITFILIGVLALLSFAACNERGNYTPPAELPEPNGKVLIAYFSHSGTTETVAKSLQEITGGDLFEIERAEAYTNVNDQSKDEIDNNRRPELAEYIDNEKMSEYDTIFVGYPIWYKTMPAPVRTFLEHYDLSGKSVISFCTAASDGIGGSNDDFEQVCAACRRRRRERDFRQTFQNKRNKRNARLDSISRLDGQRN